MDAKSEAKAEAKNEAVTHMEIDAKESPLQDLADDSKAASKETKETDGHETKLVEGAIFPKAQSKVPVDKPIEPDGKRDDDYWNGPKGVLKRATVFVYRRIIAPAEEGGMRDFFVENCPLFKGIKKADEQSLEFMPLYREYETLVDVALADFAVSEGLGGSTGGDGASSHSQEEIRARASAELGALLQEATGAGATTSANRSLSMLAAAGDYTKFVSMMATKAREGV
mmetsp:Transcript_49030/g.111221  ORF Transcript_49030/g.111221 Transcript_49030/m.111221 type:complete len:227 (+) Transcript_49030:61-741(+)|eukprot:CAMPEP_0172630282 /NCGR_PEP_ID=MMETSP1068-20121228/172917_1 /TAXON_ID=35684 /ORGANISM="Pseudopedinella elastica, Strain CCMP716" /LENGTH=226 /DNA_ID=CAMNT_0013441089 /DNA_START=203 /DNA_END=883 /DNA_ORIENTATION=+